MPKLIMLVGSQMALQGDGRLHSSHSPDTDDAICVAGVEGGSISRPVDGDTVGHLSLLAQLLLPLRPQLINN